MTEPNAKFPLDQYHALRTGFGILPLEGWSSVTFAGADRELFLNNFCTNDVKRLVPGEHCEAFITNVKGKILGHGLVHCRESELVFITVPEQAAALIEHLERYIIREDVQLRDSTAERGYLLESGGDAAGRGPEAENWIRWRLLDTELCGLREVHRADLPRVQQEAQAAGAVLCGEAAFHAMRIESGTPLFGVDFNADNLPQEVGRDELAISFTKGCYLGQETVARIDALGHVNQLLVGVRFTGPNVPPAGLELTSGENPAGRVTSASYSPRLESPLALAMVRRQWIPPGTRLQSAAGACEVVELPVHA
jgi:folate-binding protein YgfZ